MSFNRILLYISYCYLVDQLLALIGTSLTWFSSTKVTDRVNVKKMKPEIYYVCIRSLLEVKTLEGKPRCLRTNELTGKDSIRIFLLIYDSLCRSRNEDEMHFCTFCKETPCDVILFRLRNLKDSLGSFKCIYVHKYCIINLKAGLQNDLGLKHDYGR